jgi:hypothetical protein
MRIEIIVFRPETHGNVNFQDGLSDWICFFDKPDIHLADPQLGVAESLLEIGILHKISP